MRNAGRVVSKTMILSHVWDYRFDPQTNIVDVLVSRLREKIDRPFEQASCSTPSGAWAMSCEPSVRTRTAACQPFPAAGLRPPPRPCWYATAVRRRLARHRRRLTYLLTAASLESATARFLEAKLGEYAASLPAAAGFEALAETVEAEQRTAPERLFVRVVDRGDRRRSSSSQPDGWDLQRASSSTALRAAGRHRSCRWGRAPEAREDLLARFRAVLGLVTLTVDGAMALLGGMAGDTRRPLRPIRRLDRVPCRDIISTGRTDERVGVRRGTRRRDR